MSLWCDEHLQQEIYSWRGKLNRTYREERRSTNRHLNQQQQDSIKAKRPHKAPRIHALPRLRHVR